MSEEYDTPVERPALPENVPYVRVLGHLTLQISALNSNLASITHECRVAREPVADTGLVGKLKAAFTVLKGIAIAGEEAFETK